MDTAVIAQKLESLRRCIVRLESRCPASAEALKADIDLQDIVALNLTRAVQLSVDIAAHWLADHGNVASPQTMGQTFSLLAEGGVINDELAQRLRKSVGFRNIVVHNYEAIDWEIVFAICSQQLKDFRELAASFDRYL
jgi:uncharacterized protein YutE (UPF0331/DUF86 family)